MVERGGGGGGAEEEEDGEEEGEEEILEEEGEVIWAEMDEEGTLEEEEIKTTKECLMIEMGDMVGPLEEEGIRIKDPE